MFNSILRGAHSSAQYHRSSASSSLTATTIGLLLRTAVIPIHYISLAFFNNVNIKPYGPEAGLNAVDSAVMKETVLTKSTLIPSEKINL